MSTEGEETQVRSDNVNIDISKENTSVSELTSDSGVDNADSCSAAFPLSSDSEDSPIKCPETASKIDTHGSVVVGVENESGSSLSSPVSISPDENDFNDVPRSCDESPSHENCASDEGISTKEEIPDVVTSEGTCLNEANAGAQSNSEADVSNYEIKCTDLNLNSKALTMSTSSLDEQKSINNPTMSQFSKSAENISAVDQALEKTNLSTNELNTEEILAQFANHKPKVGATQKIPENPQTQNLDVRYARIPKELLSQDLGSIVKNVHGIFSSVSGSLKSAYNSTHRASIQKAPIKSLVKTVPNGKVMKEIFEDEVVEEKPLLNGIEKTNENHTEVQNIALISEHESSDTDGDTKNDVLKLQVETLEKLLGEQRKENASLRERVKQHLDELEEKDQTFKDLEAKLDLVRSEFIYNFIPFPMKGRQSSSCQFPITYCCLSFNTKIKNRN